MVCLQTSRENKIGWFDSSYTPEDERFNMNNVIFTLATFNKLVYSVAGGDNLIPCRNYNIHVNNM